MIQQKIHSFPVPSSHTSSIPKAIIKAIPTYKKIRDVNIMCLLYHVCRVKYIIHQKCFDGDPRPMSLFHRYYFCHVGQKRITKMFFFICDFLFCPVDFLYSLRSQKILRAELPDSHIFVRHFVPSKMVHWGSQAYGILPQILLESCWLETARPK